MQAGAERGPVPPPDSRVPVDAIRREARLAVEAGSLRAVARAVGMSAMGLRAFLDGRAPYSATLRKLTAWYVKHASTRPCFSAEDAQAAVAVLLEAVPDAERGDAGAELLDWLLEMHRQRRLPPPPWLPGLRGRE
jgi:hypothetical protein